MITASSPTTSSTSLSLLLRRHHRLFSNKIVTRHAKITTGRTTPPSSRLRPLQCHSFLEQPKRYFSLQPVVGNNQPFIVGGEVINVSDIARPIREEVRDYTRRLNERGIEPPLLLGILANDDPAAKLFCKSTAKICRQDGIHYERRIVHDQSQIEHVIQDANDDPHVNGIIVYYPIFKNRWGKSERGPYRHMLSGVYYKSHDDFLRDKISPECDVEGLCCTYNCRVLYKDMKYVYDDDGIHSSFKYIFPCTAMSVVKILEYCCNKESSSYATTYLPPPVGKRFEGKIITVINRSEIFGRPFAAMLSHDGATVFSIDVDSVILFRGGRMKRLDDSVTLQQCVNESSIVVTGVPDPGFRLPSEWIRPYSVVVNVASCKNVDETELLQLVEGVKYVPLVGQVTVAVLERNLVCLHRRYHCSSLLEREEEDLFRCE